LNVAHFYIDSIVLNVNRITFKYYSRLGDKIVRQQSTSKNIMTHRDFLKTVFWGGTGVVLGGMGFF
jgi:hypothetical protein